MTAKRVVTLVAGFVLAVVMAACPDEEPSGRQDSGPWDVVVAIKPNDASPPSSARPADGDDGRGQRIGIYVDLSIPFGGFVPTNAASDNGGGDLRIVAQLLADHLGLAYPDVPVRWHGVAEAVRDLPGNIVFRERSVFTGTESRIDAAIGEILDNLQSGNMPAAAIVTDLLGTGASNGAAEVAPHLIPWLASADRRAADLHFLLVGLQASYWGAFHPVQCPPIERGLGCWYSERGKEWKTRLESAIHVPLYLMIFGRNADLLIDAANAIMQDMKEVWGASPGGNRLMSEIFTASEVDAADDFRVTVTATPRNVLRRDHDRGLYRCIRSDEVRLHVSKWGRFVAAEAHVAERAEVGELSSPFRVLDDFEGGDVAVEVDCGMLRDSGVYPALDLVAMGALRPREYNGDTSAGLNWDGWSIPDDDRDEHPERTLQLRYFVERIRVNRVDPSSHRVEMTLLAAGQS